jgi:hypothetical protein
MKQFLIAAFLLTASAFPAAAQGTTAVTPAMDGIFEAFKTHPLVGLGEHHRRVQELDFYAALVRDPRFARDVGNVVVEFGGAAHQDIIDRYVEGQDVPYAELRKVWTDTVGWLPVVTAIGYPNFFAQVRETNLALPPEKRIHVWLADPVIDWSKLKTHDEWLALDKTRDSFPAALVEKQILAQKKKALMIYGDGHFWPSIPGTAGEKMEKAHFAERELGDIIRTDYPGSLFVVLFYGGTKNRACSQDMESGMADWPTPALATPLKDSALAAKLRNCSTLTVEGLNVPPGLTEAEKQQLLSYYRDSASQGDALLYLGPSAGLTYSPYIPDLYLDQDYGRIVAQHHLLQTGETFPTYLIKDYANPAKKVYP